jgi:endonuclease YncB( thermonuclease family)
MGAILLIASPADLFGRVPRLAGQIAAPASEVAVIDGQTLRMRETVLRLQGVTAGLRGQLCLDAGGAAYDCGAAASRRLAGLIGGHDVVCQLDGRDPAGLPQGQCFAGEVALNAAMRGEAGRK